MALYKEIRMKTYFQRVPIALVKKKIAAHEIEPDEPSSSVIQKDMITEKAEPYSVQVPGMLRREGDL